MVSVIIPTFNRSAFLMEALASVLGQTKRDMEVIVVDDGSTDDTSRVVEAFGQEVKYCRQIHAGVSAARNKGIRAASGEWLAFLDSDDIWLPRKLESQLDFLFRHPEIKICQTEEIWIRNGRRMNPRKYHAKPKGYCFEVLLERCLVSPSAVMIHRSLFDEVGLFDEALPACEDYDLWVRIGYRYPIGLVEMPLIVKRGGHSDQLSSSVPALDRYRIEVLARLVRNEDLNGSQQALVLDVLKRKCRIYAEGCRKRGKAQEVERVSALLRALALEVGAGREGVSGFGA